MDKNLKKVYRYWLGKTDGLLHKEISYVSINKIQSELNYIIYDSQYKIRESMSKEEFDNKMLKRTSSQSIYLWKENDDLAFEHFKWALDEKLNKLHSQIEDAKRVKKNLVGQRADHLVMTKPVEE